MMILLCLQTISDSVMPIFFFFFFFERTQKCSLLSKPFTENGLRYQKWAFKRCYHTIHVIMYSTISQHTAEVCILHFKVQNISLGMFGFYTLKFKNLDFTSNVICVLISKPSVKFILMCPLSDM